MVKKHKHHPLINRIRKELDKIEDDIADKVVHELKEKKLVCKQAKKKRK